MRGRCVATFCEAVSMVGLSTKQEKELMRLQTDTHEGCLEREEFIKLHLHLRLRICQTVEIALPKC